MESLAYKLAILVTVILQLFCSSTAQANSVSDEALLRTVGKQLYLRKNWAGAEAVYHRLIDICPKDYFAREKLVKALLADGKYTEAVNVAKQLVVMQPAEPESYYLLGKCLEQISNYNDALKNYKKAHILCAANLNYVLAMVRVYRKSGHASDAVDLLKPILQKHQQLSLLWGTLFESAVDSEKIDIAHEALEQFCKLIRQERSTDEQKKDLIAAGWHMISLDCWRAASYRDQLLLCYSLDDNYSATRLIEVAKIKFLDTPEVFLALGRVISDNEKAVERQRNTQAWSDLRKRIEYLRKQGQKLASN